MKYNITLLICMVLGGIHLNYAQTIGGNSNSSPKEKEKENNQVLKTKTYFKFGYSHSSHLTTTDNRNVYLANLITTECGSIFYIGKAFANQKLRAGLNVDYYSITGGLSENGSSLNVGPKLGAVISCNPVDKLVIDIYGKCMPSYLYFDVASKTNFSKFMGPALFKSSNISAGSYVTNYTLGLNVRYRLILLGLEWYKVSKVNGIHTDSYEIEGDAYSFPYNIQAKLNDSRWAASIGLVL